MARILSFFNICLTTLHRNTIEFITAQAITHYMPHCKYSLNFIYYYSLIKKLEGRRL